MTATNADLERQFYAANLGLTAAQASVLSLADLAQRFANQRFVTQQALADRPTVAAAPAAFSATYTAAEVESLAVTVRALRTALINAGVVK